MFSFWRYFQRKAGGPARLRSASVVQLLSRPVRPRTRSATLRSALTECDDIWWSISESLPVFQGPGEKSKVAAGTCPAGQRSFGMVEKVA